MSELTFLLNRMNQRMADSNAGELENTALIMLVGLLASITLATLF